MANPYAYNVLTFAGAALIAQATAANPIVIVGAVSRATAASSDEDLASKDASWYTGKTGIIEAVSASANVAKIVARFDPAGARQDAKSIAVTARLASQTDADAIVLTAKSDPDATAILPGSGDTLAYVRFPFNIGINTTGSVQVTPGASASMADLARFVSLHKAGDPTQGEAQTILGEKTFDGNARFDGSVTVRGGVLKADVVQPYSNGPIEIGNGIVPDTDGAFDLGSEDYNFGAAYTGRVYSNSNELTVCAYNADNDTQMAFLDLDTATTDDPHILLETSDTDDNRASLYLRRVGGNAQVTISPDAQLGTTANPIDAIRANNGYFQQIGPAPGQTELMTLSLKPGLPGATVGVNGSPYAELWADDIHGVIPRPTSAAIPPIGSIFWGAVQYSGSSASSVTFGQLLQVGSGNVTTITAAEYSTANNRFEASGVGNFNTGKYRALSVGSEPGGGYCFVLLIHVE